MIDLAFVRANLPLVKEKLRARGIDPETVLGNFEDIDGNRRQAITSAENFKAQRNVLTEEIATLRRNGLDTSSQIEETKRLKSKGDALEVKAAEADQRMQFILESVPNLPQDSVPIGKNEHANSVEKT